MKKIFFVILVTTLLLLPGPAWSALTKTQVSQLYISVFGRASEGNGNAYWVNDALSWDMSTTADVMLATDAARLYFGSTLNDNQAFIEHIYLNTLGKTNGEDPGGINYWVSALDSGKTRGQVVAALVSSAMDAANAGAAQDRFNNKVTVSDYCANTLAGYTELSVFSGFISSVTHDAASVIDAKKQIDSSADANQKPVASPVSLNTNSSVPYFQQQLIGSDPDGDTITYELVSPASGVGYSQAYVNGQTGMLYITNEPSGDDSFTLSYRVTDGMGFSDPAPIVIQVVYLSENGKNTGSENVKPEEYAGFDLSTYSSDLLGGNNAPSQPVSVDLTLNFPFPGDQGRQNSCVGWATAYALKSFQEKVEIGWSLNTSSHLFSPAFVYNQIVIGNDGGSYINDALDLIVNKGGATLSTMPYSDQDYLSQPSSSAFGEAALYRAAKWYRINDTSQITAALVNRQPVVCGIEVFESFVNLSGADSVYNTASGKSLGGHAVTIIGYDDTKYGGAFRVINSWSANWGDDGYFWLPYSFASQGILKEAYVLFDSENGTNPGAEQPTEPQPDLATLPNLTIQSWDASFDPKPNGTGKLTYRVINAGAGVAPQGADVSLVLSKNRSITNSDYYIIYEQIPFALDPGQIAYRDTVNPISFRFPDNLEPGVYYLGLWVDDLDEIKESNEDDNISGADGTVTIENTLSDLSVNTWYAKWDDNGKGSLSYEVSNIGYSATAATSWGVNLVLDVDQTLGNNNEIYLFSESITDFLTPGQMVYRDENHSASFNLFVDVYGKTVPQGVYYMALWVDDLNRENESNELNNGSYSWDFLDIAYSGQNPMSLEKDRSDSELQSPGRAYNGRRLPSKEMLLRKVKFSRTLAGGVSMEPLGTMIKTAAVPHTKAISSKAKLIFPSTGQISLPGGE